MIIVSGRIALKSGSRDEFLEKSRDAMVQARGTTGCRDFVVAADPLDPNRVNVYEEWESEQALHAFREAGPGDDLGTLILEADVSTHRVDSE